MLCRWLFHLWYIIGILVSQFLKDFGRIFMFLFSDTLEDKLPYNFLNDYHAKIDEFEDELLIEASQLYKKSRVVNDNEEAIDHLLLDTSQEVEKQLAKHAESEQKTLLTLMT